MDIESFRAAKALASDCLGVGDDGLPASQTPTVLIEDTVAGKVSFATHQSAVPVMRDLRVETRARAEMMVFSSFDPHMIDLNRTSADAVRDLKHFLEFAERGSRALGQAVQGSMGGYDSPFEQAVAEGLRDRGWSVATQVGVSSYRIDLGIVHPDRPGDYLCGVECDCATYHSERRPETATRCARPSSASSAGRSPASGRPTGGSTAGPRWTGCTRDSRRCLRSADVPMRRPRPTASSAAPCPRLTRRRSPAATLRQPTLERTA
jgi:hypothetical protein